MVLTMNEHPNGLLEAKGITRDEGSSDLSHPSFLSLPQTMVSKVIEVQYPWHLQCHLSQTVQTGPDILDKAEDIDKNSYEDKPPHL